MDIKNFKSQISGQSMVEMTVGVLAVVLMLVGILQICRLGMAHTQVLMDAREQADEMAIDDQLELSDITPGYLQRVVEGNDEKPYSEDDQMISGEPQEVRDTIIAHSTPKLLRGWVSVNTMNSLNDSSILVDEFDFVYGQGHSENIELYPIIRNLVVEDESIRMNRRVWMPWMRELD